MKKEFVIKVVIGLCFVITGVLFILNSNDADNSTYQANISAASSAAAAGDAGDSLDGQTVEICVYVCGEVNSPGVYFLKSGSRIKDAIDEAGGFTDDAAKEYLNLADVATDGMQVKVPSKDEAQGLEAASKEESDGLVNINTADEAKLTTLPGIGTSRAKDIIKYRESNGAFAKKEDIMKVSGIKEASYEKIKDLIKVD